MNDESNNDGNKDATGDEMPEHRLGRSDGDEGIIPLAPQPASPRPTTHPSHTAPTSTPYGHSASVPVARVAAGGGVGTGKSRLDAPSMLEARDETCPRCGARLDQDAVVCVACGYNLLANVVHEPEVGEIESDPDTDNAKRGIFVPARPNATRPLLIGGGVLMVAGMVFGGITAGQVGGSGYVLARVLLVIYLGLLHTATGSAAVIAASWLTGHRLGSLEQATARMFVAVTAFLLLLQIPDLGLHSWLASGLRWLLATAVYLVLLWMLFRRNRHETGVVAGAHAVLWLLTSLGMQLAVWLSTVQPKAP